MEYPAEARQRIAFTDVRRGCRGGSSMAAGAQLTEKEKSQIFYCKNIPITPYYLIIGMNPCISYPDSSLAKVETIRFNQNNAKRKEMTAAPFTQ